jgi:hypothetical protein
VLDAGPQSAGAIARVLWPEVDVSQTYLALCEVLGALDLLEREQAVVGVEGADGVVVFALR